MPCLLDRLLRLFGACVASSSQVSASGRCRCLASVRPHVVASCSPHGMHICRTRFARRRSIHVGVGEPFRKIASSLPPRHSLRALYVSGVCERNRLQRLGSLSAFAIRKAMRWPVFGTFRGTSLGARVLSLGPVRVVRPPFVGGGRERPRKRRIVRMQLSHHGGLQSSEQELSSNVLVVKNFELALPA